MLQDCFQLLKMYEASVKLYNDADLGILFKKWLVKTADINECALSTDNCANPTSGGLCTNIVGSFTCSCITGYTGNGIICSGKRITALRRYCQVVIHNFITFRLNIGWFLWNYKFSEGILIFYLEKQKTFHGTTVVGNRQCNANVIF